MKERAIDKMVVALESGKFGRMVDGGVVFCVEASVLEEARRLALEEAKEKSTAPASLVEDKYPYPSFPSDIDQVLASIQCAEIYLDLNNEMSSLKTAKDELEKAKRYAELINEKLRYRPSPQADIVGELKAYCATGSEWDEKKRYADGLHDAKRAVEEIIRKHQGEAK